MSCFFGLKGASVVGVDTQSAVLARARDEAKRWNLGESVDFRCYGGDPHDLPGTRYDFVFTKSVLVVVPRLPDFLAEIKRRLAPGGELLMVENARSNWATGFARKIVHRGCQDFDTVFHGVDSAFIEEVRGYFPSVSVRRFLGLVVAIRASCLHEASAHRAPTGPEDLCQK